MDWDTETHPLITRARLMSSSSDKVYEELEAYGRHLRRRPRGFLDGLEDLERALAGRKDKLIDLGLARNATNYDLLGKMYRAAQLGTGDAEHDKAVRLACLSNQVAPGMLFAWDRLPGIDSDEFARLALEGDVDEVQVLMQNPSARSVLRDVYLRKPPLDTMPDDRWLTLVAASSTNAGLNTDESDEHGPDMLAWHVRKGIFNLLAAAPLEDVWLRELHSLLLHVDPARAETPSEASAVLTMLERWKGFTIKNPFKSESEAEEQEGYYTPRSLVDEFRCLVGALYGRTFEKRGFSPIGSAESDDVALRCAWYGNGKMSQSEIRTAIGRDGHTFVFAAITNSSLLTDLPSRQLIEEEMPNDMLRLYAERRRWIKERHPWWDDSLAINRLEQIEDTPERPPEPATAESVQAVRTEVLGLRSRIRTVSTTVQWATVILGALILWKS